MTIFVVLLPTVQQPLTAKIVAEFGGNSLRINDTQWLISASGTAQEICSQLGIYDPASPNAAPVGTAIVFASSGYFGRAPTNIWEWIKVKLETPVAPLKAPVAPSAAPLAASG